MNNAGDEATEARFYMTNRHSEVRNIASRAELDNVYDMLGSVFPVGRDFFQKRLDYDSTYDLSTTWIAEQDGNMAATIQVFPYVGRVGTAAMKIGGIGSVATLPEYRGQGHSRQILQRLTEWMEQEEYDLSLLFAEIHSFYEKSGWNIVLETMYELKDVTRFADVEATGIDYDIVPFDPSYTEAVAGLYEQFNAGRTGTVIRPQSHWHDRLNWPKWNEAKCLLAKRNGKVVAYGLITAPEQDGTVYVDEICYRLGDEQALIPLFHTLVGQYSGVTRVLANVPEDHALTGSLLAWGAVKQTLPYMMWKIIRFQSLLGKLSDVFQHRLANSAIYAEQSLQIKWKCAGQEAYLHYAEGQVRIESAPRRDENYFNICLDQDEFMRLLLQGYDESVSAAQYSSVLEVLFPKQAFVFYLMDRF